jgi:cell division transport system ATP-binding protein
MRGAVIRFDKVSLRYGSDPEILSDVSFALSPGSFNYLVGPSGAGKSSLLRMMYLALKPSSGRLSVFGRDAASLDGEARALTRRKIGVVFQDFRLLDHLSTFDNVALPLRVAGAREPEIQRHVRELLAWVGLAEALDRLPPTLSGGEQQRIAVARAVIAQPSLILADEPTGNLDDAIAVRLMYLFEELNKMGTTVVIATHNQGLVERFPHPAIRIALEPDAALDAPRRAAS